MPAAHLRLGPLLRHVGPTHATVWVETSQPCTVAVAGHEERTFTVAGHHYALVTVAGLTPGTSTPYDVRLDDEAVWPLPVSPDQPATAFPASRIRTLPDPADPADPPALRIAFGSCRYASPGAASGLEPCALDALARDLAATPEGTWPALLLLIGDQVYADETTPEVHGRIDARRGDSAPEYQANDFEEYTWLYEESWSDPEVRWLLSVVPTGMIFDDHDVHDDWNTSRSWREDMRATPWWPERIVAGLSSYWVYQHLGNLSPDELDADPTWRQICDLPPGADAEPLLRELAVAADREADGGRGYRWSFARDLGRTKVVVLDSRCGRMLDDDPRSMLSPAEFAWARERIEEPADHVLVASSLPWLLAPALHDVEAWSERLAADPRPRRARLGERLRRAADLEHWAAFGRSFELLGEILTGVARGDGGPGTPPATVAVLSGDVHHSYVARTRGAAPVHQLTCSPLHNRVPAPMRLGFRVSWSRTAERGVRAVLGRLAQVPPPGIGWSRTAGPFFGNMVGVVTIEGRRSRVTLLTTHGTGAGGPRLRPVHEGTLQDGDGPPR